MFKVNLPLFSLLNPEPVDFAAELAFTDFGGEFRDELFAAQREVSRSCAR